MKYLGVCAAAAFLALASGAVAQETAPPHAGHVSFDRTTLAAGAHTFARYCLGCHSLKYLRYNRVAEDLGLSEARVKDLLMLPDNAQYHDAMTNTLRPEDAARWLGAAPPDLTLEARLRGADWIYAYLTGFYLDPSAALGWNNRVFPHVSMPNVLAPLGGAGDARGRVITAGSQSPGQFETTVNGLTSWLAYASDPSRLQRRSLALWVLPFLVSLTLLAYLLKRSYWRDIH